VTGKEDSGNETVEDHGEEERQNVECNQVDEKDVDVGLPAQLEGTFHHVLEPLVWNWFQFGKQEPRPAVDYRENPDPQNNFLGPVDRAHRLEESIVPRVNNSQFLLISPLSI